MRFIVDLTVWFQGSTPHTWQIVEVLLKEIWFRSDSQKDSHSKDFTPLPVQRNRMFINFRTVSYGPKKRSGSCDVWTVWTLWFFGKDKHGPTHEMFREFPLRWVFIGRHDLVTRSVANDIWGTCGKRNIIFPAFLGWEFLSVSRWANLLKQCSLPASRSTWFYRGLFGLIMLMPQIPYSNCPKNQLNNKYKLA